MAAGKHFAGSRPTLSDEEVDAVVRSAMERARRAAEEPLYTLSSYEPVKVSVRVPCVTDAQVDLALSSMAQQAGADESRLSDADWVRQAFGARSLDELRAGVRNDLLASNMHDVDRRKGALCLAELASRLQEEVPEQVVDEMRQGMRAGLEQDLAQSGLTVKVFCEQTGTPREDLEQSLASQAREAATQGAALDAYARERGLSASEGEWPRLLGIPPVQLAEVARQARANGNYEALARTALRNKTADIVVTECDCTYSYETPQEAEDRLQKMLRDGNGTVTPGPMGTSGLDASLPLV